MTRKGKVAEILSKATYADDPNLYIVGYLDFKTIKELSLTEFIKESSNFEIIPFTRIHYIKKGKTILFRKIGKSDSYGNSRKNSSNKGRNVEDTDKQSY